MIGWCCYNPHPLTVPPEDIDACIETAQMGNGCISTLRGEPNGAVYAVTEWIADYDFSYPGLSSTMDASRSLDIDTRRIFKMKIGNLNVEELDCLISA